MNSTRCFAVLCVVIGSPALFGQLAPAPTRPAIPPPPTVVSSTTVPTSTQAVVVAVANPPAPAPSNPATVPTPIMVGRAASSGSAGSGPTVTVAPPPTPPTVAPSQVAPVTPTVPPGSLTNARIVNLSTRAQVTAGNPLITGFAISGTASRPVLVRAAGPALTGFGVNSALVAPRLQLRDASGALVTENIGWADSATLASVFAQAGAFPFARGSADSAAVATLAPGSYTVQVSDASSGTGGVALAEIYDLGGTTGDSRLANVSTRATVATGGGELISGFVLAGDGYGTFLLRSVGPGLSKFGVTGVLSDPVLTIFDSTGRQVANNDDWNGGPKPGAVAQSVQAAQPAPGSGVVTPTMNPDLVTADSQATGAFALDANSLDAALVTTLAPGAYTVQVRGAGTVVSTVTPNAGGGSTAGAPGTVQQAAAGRSFRPRPAPRCSKSSSCRKGRAGSPDPAENTRAIKTAGSGDPALHRYQLSERSGTAGRPALL